MRPPACLFLLVIASSGACSGDDAHKQSTMPRGAPSAPAPAAPPVASAAPGGPGPAAPAAAALTEAMAAPYWASPSERLAAQQFALEQWPAARASFEALLTAAPATTTDDRTARLH